MKLIHNWPEPADKSEAKSFLQTIQFGAMFMKLEGGETYSDITRPLRDLSRQSVKFKWTNNCRKSFKKLKSLLVGLRS